MEKTKKTLLLNLTREELNQRLDALRTGEKAESVGRRGFFLRLSAALGAVGAFFGFSGCSPQVTCYSQPCEDPLPEESENPETPKTPEEPSSPEKPEESEIAGDKKEEGKESSPEEKEGEWDEEPTADCYDVVFDGDDDGNERE